MSDSIGQQLEAARTANGLTIADVAHATRVHHDVLRQLEGGEFEKLPNLMFAKSFLKLYGEHLGVDVSEAIEELESAEDARHQQFLLGGVDPSVRNRYGHLAIRIPVRPLLASAVAVIALTIAGSYLVSHLYGDTPMPLESDRPAAELDSQATGEITDGGEGEEFEWPVRSGDLSSEVVAPEPIDTTIPEKVDIDPDKIPRGLPVIRDEQPQLGEPAGTTATDDSEDAPAPPSDGRFGLFPQE